MSATSHLDVLNLGLDVGVVAEHQVLACGRTVLVYRCPYPSEGPLRIRVAGQDCLVYMYAHFVFTWPAGGNLVNIAHGTIKDSLPLWRDHPIEGPWRPESLARFGRSWTRRHLASFQPPTTGDDRTGTVRS